ncbi:PKD-like domain-containing protein, partial [Dysgonomonas sp. GY617]|uniref:PKD-like domain-containing protein n=1 Tax=Dysgonomonas sp. GY617 TaxID=2780420 RepID=UPI0018EFC55C
METKYKILRIILLFITLLVVNGDLLAQSAQTINPNGGASASLDDGLKVVVNINGTLSVYRQNQTQYFSGYVWPDGAGNGVTLNFRFDNGTTYNSTSLTMTACSTTAAQQVGNDWTTSISGYVTSPISSKKFFVTMNFKYTHPNRYFLVDYIVRAPFDLPAPETVHLYLSHDAYILGSDGSRGYITQNTSGHFVGDYRDASDSNTTCSGSKKNPVFPSTHGFKTSGTGFRSYYSGPYSPRNTIDASTLKLTNTLGTTCIDDGIAVEFTIGPLAAGQVGTKGVIHAYGNTKGEFDNTPVSDPVPPTNISTPVSVNFVSATISEPEGNVSHPANNIQIVAGGGRLYQEQVCNFSVVSGGTAVQGTDFTYVKGFIIPAGDYSTPKTLTLDNFTILGNTTCQNNRTIRIQIDSEVCNDLVQRGTTILTTYTIADDDIPTVSQPSNKVFCNKETVAANTFVFTGSTLPNTTYTWTNSNTAIGLAASGTGNIPAFTATNTGTAPLIATITVTPNQGSCVGDPKQFTITVNPTATIGTVLNNLTYCGGSSSPAITLTSATTGTTYAWTNSNTAIGLAVSGTGNIPAFTATNATANPITATIRVTPTANGCVGTYKEYTITVNPTPTVSTVLNNLTYCNASSSPAITLASATTGTTYTWTNTNTAIGLAASGTGNIPAFTATNATANPITATIRVTPTANGCVGTYKEYTITVNPTPTVSTVLNNLTYCNSSSSPAITLASATTGTT